MVRSRDLSCACRLSNILELCGPLRYSKESEFISFNIVCIVSVPASQHFQSLSRIDLGPGHAEDVLEYLGSSAVHSGDDLR